MCVRPMSAICSVTDAHALFDISLDSIRLRMCISHLISEILAVYEKWSLLRGEKPADDDDDHDIADHVAQPT